MRDEGSAVAGSNYSLFCDVTIPPLLRDINAVSSPSVTWTYPSGEVHHAFGNSVQLVIYPLTIDDEGTYNCTAYYHVGGVTSPSTISFHRVLVGKSFSSQLCGKTIVFLCIYSVTIFRTS